MSAWINDRHAGVPVVTLRTKGAGSIHSHNVSASILIQAGLEEFVADTEEEYLRIVLDLAEVLSSGRRMIL